MSRLSDEEKLSETARLLQGVEPTEEYSLEDILAEFGQGAAEPAQLPVSDPAPVSETDDAPQPAAPEAKEAPPEEPVQPPEADASGETPENEPNDSPAPSAWPEEPPVPDEQPEQASVPEDAPEEQKVPIEQVMSETVSAVLEETDDEILEEREPLRERAERLVLGAAERLRALRERKKPSGGAWEQPQREEPEEPPEPEPDMDTAAREEKQRCRRLRKELLHLSIPTAVLIILSVCDGLGLVPAVWQELDVLRGAVMGAGLIVCILLARPVWRAALEKLRARRIGCEAACAVVCAVCLAHCVFTALAGGPLPYAACAAALVWASEYGLLLASESRWESFRLADLGGAPPYVVSVTAAGACKQRGSLDGFYRTTMRPGPAERWQVILTPLLLTAATVLAGVVCIGGGKMNQLLWVWSAILSAAMPLSLPLTGALPLRRLSRHLARSGSAAAGYQGARAVSTSKRMVLTDTDLFPPGTVELNGLKIYGEEIGKVASYAATLAAAAQSPLAPIFEQLLAAESGVRQPLEDLQFYEEGGFGGTIHGETVMMGSAYFMKQCKVTLPRELKLKTGVFLSVDGQLIAIFAIKYQASRNVDWALRAVRRNRIQPVLAVREGNVTPGLLKRKFSFDVKPVYPDVSTRLALSELTEQRGQPNAVIYREGLMPFAETVIGSRRLLRAVRTGTILAYFGALAGLLLSYYLTGLGSTDLLHPMQMLGYLGLWLVPPVLLSGLVKLY